MRCDLWQTNPYNTHTNTLTCSSIFTKSARQRLISHSLGWQCIAKFAAAETLESFRGRSGALKTVRFKSFPKYLALHMRRYYVEGWTPKKLSVQVQVPDELDLNALR